MEGRIRHSPGLEPLGEESHGEREQKDARQGEEGAQRARAPTGGLRAETRQASAGSQEAGGGAERRKSQESGGAEEEAETGAG